MKLKVLLILIILFKFTSNAQTKILFDASKGQMAGNADWIIDADIFNIRFTGGPASIGGSESNPQRVPTPSQSGINATTTEDFWTGAASAWAVDCAKIGYLVESLPYNSLLTFGDLSNPQDLSNYKVFITIEPNILYSSSEKIALLNFVQNGGGLFMVSGHDGADRNFDGYDAIGVLNDFMNNNSIGVNPFGINFNVNNTGNITSTNLANVASNPILSGSFGNVTLIKYFQGATININQTLNSSAQGLIYQTGLSTTGNNGILFASSTYGLGKVAAIGDSSPIDDGTGDLNDNLFFGYSDANGSHRKLIMNATQWLATQNLANETYFIDTLDINISQNPTKDKKLIINFNLHEDEKKLKIEILDNLGRITTTDTLIDNKLGTNAKSISLENLNTGIYFCKISTESKSKTIKFILN